MATSVEPDFGRRGDWIQQDPTAALPAAPDAPGPGFDSPAQWGVRGRINSVLGHAATLAPAPAEVAARSDRTALAAALPLHQTVMVASLEDGAGKTPTTIMLSNIFGRYRDGGVVEWDLSGRGSTLGRRAAFNVDSGLSARTLLAEASTLTSPESNGRDLARHLCRQPTGDELLTSEPLTPAECATVLEVLSAHRQTVFLDTDSDHLSATWRWAASGASAVVVPFSYRGGSVSKVRGLLAALSSAGLGDPARRVIVVACARPGVSPSSVDAVRSELEAMNIAAVVDVPYDPMLAGSVRIDQSRLAPATTRAWTHAAAVVVQLLSGAPMTATDESVRGLEVRGLDTFDHTTEALRARATTTTRGATEQRPAGPSVRTRIGNTARRNAVLGLGVLGTAAVATIVWASIGSAEEPASPASVVPARAPESGPRSSGPAVIEEYDDQYYVARSAEGAASLWTLDRVTDVDAAVRLSTLQRNIDSIDPAVTHRLDITATVDPRVFDAVLTLTTPDGVDHPYNQQFTVVNDNGTYSIVSKKDCSTVCPAP